MEWVLVISTLGSTGCVLSLAHGFRRARAQLRERIIEIDLLLGEIRKTRDEMEELRANYTPVGMLNPFEFRPVGSPCSPVTGLPK